ncbi:P-loop containing nucleoside triphosphate hydrolase protein, partial [Catenaria anguillulae PL171]
MSGSAADEEDAPHGFPPHLPPFLQVENNALPFVRPESISVTLDDVVGQAQAKQALDALITLPMQHPEQFSSGVLSLTSAAGVLLYGPPGTGKTMLAKAVAKSAGATFIAMNPSDIQDKFVGESEKTIKRLFETARRKAPCVIFLDEVDALFSKRDFDRQGYRRDILNEFCMQWDGIKGSKNVIVLGATNRPFDLDEAVLRRFSRRVLVDLPSATEKRHLLVSLLKDETLESPDLIDSLLPQLVHHSASDIKNVAIAAAMAAVRERPVGPRVLGRRHFDAALKDVRPSVSNAMDAIVKLREFASTMEGDGSGLKRVGFILPTLGRGWWVMRGAH